MFFVFIDYLKQLNFVLGPESSLFCQHCDETFLHVNEYFVHLKIHEKDSFSVSNKDLKFKLWCNFCEYKTNCQSDLKKHVQVHAQQERIFKFSCHLCVYKTNRHADLKRHTLVHTQERPFICNTCGKAFNQKANLRTHMFSVHFKKI